MPPVSGPSGCAEPAQQGAVRPPPPIIVQDKGVWSDLSAELSRKKIHFLHATCIAAGIQIKVQNSDYHRKLTNYLSERKLQYYTYTLEEERLLRVVIRRVPKEIAVSDVAASLREQNYPIRDAFRMHHQYTKRPFDMVLVTLDRTRQGKDIFSLKTVCGLSGVSVETPRKSHYPSQCHNCQNYGHSARNCHLNPRCVKCTGDHATKDCTRMMDSAEPPSCVRCGKTGHPANYRGCERAPRIKRPPRQVRAGPRGPVKASRPAPPPLMSVKAFPSLKVPSGAYAPVPTLPARAPQAAWARKSNPQMEAGPLEIPQDLFQGDSFFAVTEILATHDLNEILAFNSRVNKAKNSVDLFGAIASFPGVAATIQRLTRAKHNK